MEFKSPVYNVIAVPISKIIPNTYNPNAVAPPELKLLYDSIKEDGYTMPVVCYYSKKQDLYVIVDGFHRYRIMLEHEDIYRREKGLLPVSVINKPLDQRMASTIRHNRARGAHDVDLMSNIVKELHELGRSDSWISKHLILKNQRSRLCYKEKLLKISGLCFKMNIILINAEYNKKVKARSRYVS